MAPLNQIAMHLVGSQSHQFITLLTRFHGLQLIEDFEKHGSIMAHRNSLHRIIYRCRLLGYLLGILHIIRVINVELKTAHDGEMVPKLLLMVLHAPIFREHTVHDSDDGFSTMLALVAVFQLHTVVYHLLNLASILWHNEFLSLRIII